MCAPPGILAVALTVVMLLATALALCGCGSAREVLKPYEPTGEDITVTSPAGLQITLKGDKADLYREVEYIREAIESGRVEWDAEALAEMVSTLSGLGDQVAGDFALQDVVGLDPFGDPLAVLDGVEETLFVSKVVNMFLVKSTPQEQVGALVVAVQQRDDVKSAVLVSKDEAFAMMQDKLRDNPELFKDLPANPFPDKIEVTLKSGVDVEAFIEHYSSVDAVDEVRETEDYTAPAFSDVLFGVVKVLAYGPYYYEQVYK